MVTEKNKKHLEHIKEKLIKALVEFSRYQMELFHSLDEDPMAVITDLGKWNNEHQRRAASVQFFAQEFIKELSAGNFTTEEGNWIALQFEQLKRQEDLLYEKVYAIRKNMMTERKRLEKSQKALSQYATTAKDHSVIYLSRDA